jgi:predicted O-linked N-acetylglucosamine transferase (SPINDLY family)
VAGVQRALEQAVQYHRQGRLHDAERLYRDALRESPRDFDTLNMLGVLKLQQGGASDALPLLQQAIEVRPNALDVLSNLSVALLALNRPAEALANFDKILSVQSQDVSALFGRGTVLAQLGRPDEALVSLDRALSVNPNHAPALFNRATILAGLGRYPGALLAYDRVIALVPGHVDALNNRGNVLAQLERYAEAVASYDRVLAIKPDHVGALTNRAAALRQLGRYDEALASCDRALAVDPNYIDALNNRGNVLLQLDRAAEALECYDRVLTSRRENPEALVNSAFASHALGNYEESLRCAEEALALDPDYANAAQIRGHALARLGRLDEAVESYERALAIDPDHREALINLVWALRDLDRPEEALLRCQQALAVKGDDVDLLYQCALLLARLQRFGEAAACYEQMLMLKPDSVEALVGKASILTHYWRFAESLVLLEQALSIRANDVDILSRRAYAHARLGRLDEACAGYERVLAIDPGNLEVLGELAGCYVSMGDWQRAGPVVDQLDRWIADGTLIGSPFVLLGRPLSAAVLSQYTTRFVAKNFPERKPLARERRSPDHGRIRVAYLSADFRLHATGYLAAGLFEQHDRSRFEIIGVSLGPDDGSEVRARLVRAFDQFHDVGSRSDREVAQLLQDLGVDIAIDLMGHTRLSRPGIFAYRPAAIRVAFLGYPGSTGANFIDYLIADRVVVPPEDQASYTEQIVRLPDSYQVNDSKRPIAERVPSRSEIGLPENAFVFCSFNQIWKINRPIFAIWMRLLRAVEGSVLWLIKSNDFAMANLRKEAQAQGVEPQRLIFASQLEHSAHLARLKLADLVLDTLPCNAHTTASDALWAGVPLVTCTGPTFAGRVAASLLHAVGLPELVTDNLDDYEVLALKLATDPPLLKSVVSRLAQNRLTHPLFDTARFTRHIEAAYTTMWETSQRGEAPRAFSVEPIEH